MDRRKIIITCEHAGNYVPKDYILLFTGNESVLNTHEGWDLGAFGVARFLAKHLKAPLHYQKITRLLVEVNRSLDSKQLFSRFSDKLDDLAKEHILDKYYHTYRNEVEARVQESVTQGEPVLHLSIHTFVPEINGIERSVDIGILFDEGRPEELIFSTKWKDELDTQLPDLIVLHNVPYRGTDDGLATYLRSKFLGKGYLGIEVEVNQKYIDTPMIKTIENALLSFLQKSKGEFSSVC